MAEKQKEVNYWKIFLIIIGALFAAFIVLIIFIIVALAIIKPFGVDVTETPALIFGPDSDATSSYDHPLLSSEQEVMLESIGIDTTTIPTEITAAQEQCAVDALGQTRVQEILNGDAPTISDFVKTQNCF